MRPSCYPFTAGLSVVLILATCFLLFLAPSISQAADQIVTNTNNAGPGSLRQAVNDVGAGEEITFNLPAASTIALTTGRIDINKNLTITGPGARQLTIDGNGSNIFFQTAGDFNVSGLNLIHAPGDDGCIHSEGGTINVSDCRFEGITGIGLFLANGNNGFNVNRCLFTNCNTPGPPGAGLFSENTSGTITNCTFSENTVVSSGGD